MMPRDLQRTASAAPAVAAQAARAAPVAVAAVVTHRPAAIATVRPLTFLSWLVSLLHRRSVQ